MTIAAQINGADNTLRDRQPKHTGNELSLPKSIHRILWIFYSLPVLWQPSVLPRGLALMNVVRDAGGIPRD